VKPAGVVAAGHPATADAAAVILEAGGNAFDAVIAGQFAACAAEPVLCSLGGGGFLLTRQGEGPVEALDFFVQTPVCKRPLEEIEFLPILADFGDAQQEFHIGLGSVATPGMVRGLFAAHRRVGSLPMSVLVEPAVRIAREGVVVNALQAHAFGIVGAIYSHSEASRTLYASPTRPGSLVVEGDLLRQTALADTLEHMAREGEYWFYEGEFAHLVAELCRRDGGLLGLEDLRRYRAELREPLALDYRGNRIWTNPPPSSGGLLLGFALKLLEALEPPRDGFGSAAHLERLARVMDMTDRARLEAQPGGDGRVDAGRLLDPELLGRYLLEVGGLTPAVRGTTHLSVMDAQGNVASLTASNGEGCGVLIPDTGVMLNNMLGEQDLNPGGFFRWRENQRLTSMMAPTLLARADGSEVALGSGGSNRIRTAILQVLVNLLDFGMPLGAAVDASRIHLEQGLLSVEGGFGADVDLGPLLGRYPEHRVWGGRSLFFGGVHAVALEAGGFCGAGDSRRGGVVRVAGPAGDSHAAG
jgi:gamma-glutamyltranspeptidase / glutathione hydrolase